MAQSRHTITVEIGKCPVSFHTSDTDFLRLLENRYAGFVGSPRSSEFEFEVTIADPGMDLDADVQVLVRAGRWLLERGDFRADLDPAERRGTIRQLSNPYSTDTALRILHSLILAKQGGFLLHAASAIKDGRAFLFMGASGAGKTTIASLAPPEVALLTDEVSYVRSDGGGYRAFGTPFAGELARSGENLSAPIAELYLLAKGPRNGMATLSPAEACQALLSNILFFAQDPELVSKLFDSACEFVRRVPVRRLTFAPDPSVWRMVH